LPPSQPSICVVGSVNLDLVVRCERLPRPGETLSGGTFEQIPGGKGANQALAAHRLGGDVTFVGCAGRDDFADKALAGLREAGVHLDVRESDEPTGIAAILVAEDGENQIVVVPGANSELTRADVDADAVLCQLEVPDVALLSAARGARHLFALNAAPARPVPREVLERADILVVNEYELESIGVLPPQAPALGKQRRFVAVTLGARGAVLVDEDGSEIVRAEPPEVDAVDGTAAGDAFTACFVMSILEEREPEEALRRACAAGALAASRFGAQPSLPTADEVDAILRA
jgi:ribokinase